MTITSERGKVVLRLADGESTVSWTPSAAREIAERIIGTANAIEAAKIMRPSCVWVSSAVAKSKKCVCHFCKTNTKPVVGQKVKVVSRGSSFFGHVGEVVEVYPTNAVKVLFKELAFGRVLLFLHSEYALVTEGVTKG